MTDLQKLHNLVGGERTAPADGHYTDVVDPSTGEAYAQAPLSGPADIDAAYAAAQRAFEGWRETTPAERQHSLLRIADAVEARAEELVEAESRNTGKLVPLTMSEEIPPMVDQIRFFAGAARVLEGRAAGEYMRGHTTLSTPAGRTSAAISASSRVETGVVSLGLRTTVLPAAIAGASFQTAIIIG